MDNVPLLNCLPNLGDSLGTFLRLFSELSLLALLGFISQTAGLGLLVRILVITLLIGLALMNIFPFQPLVDCENRANLNQYSYGIFEAILLNLIHPPAMNWFGALDENHKSHSRAKSEGAVLRIVVNRNLRNRDLTQYVPKFESDISQEFQINNVEHQTRESLDKWEKEGDPGSTAQFAKHKDNEFNLGAPEALKTLEQVDLRLEPSDNPEVIKMELQNIEENADALKVWYAKSTERRDRTFIRRMTSTQIESANVSITPSKASTILSRYANIEKVTVYSPISELIICDNTDGIERVLSVVNPNSSLDSNQDQEFVSRSRENSEDIEVLLLVEGSSKSSADSIITRRKGSG